MLTRYIIPTIAVLGVIFAVGFVMNGNKPVPAAMPVAQPSMAPFADYVAGAGIVEPSTENIDIGTPVAGVVTRLDHWIGDHVKAGDVLFRIDSRDQDAELKVRQAALVSARANVLAEQASADDADNQWKKVRELGPQAMSQEDLDKRKFAAAAADAKLTQARADVVSAEASIESTQTELERRIIRAPVDGTVLQCKIHVGEFAAAAAVVPETDPLMVMGNTDVLNVRVDVDENDAWRIDTKEPAMAFVRSNRDMSTPLKFVRVEPLVVPKKSLTGDSTERVDTRVLQLLYSFDPKSLKKIYVGQQMDVFIEAPPIGK